MKMKLLTAVAALVASSATVAEYKDPWEMLTFNCVDRDDGTTSSYTFWRFNGESEKSTEGISYKGGSWESNAYTLTAYLYRTDAREELASVWKIDRSTGQMTRTQFMLGGSVENTYDCELRPDNKF